ncbi:uncharacterized protein K460DRAFT_250365, partial [Cucurbitaria berberidis CBS 394.84]
PKATVTVGDAGKLVFSPLSLNATVGSMIAFDFLGLNHSLTQSNFWDPCQSNKMFDSGFEQFNPTNMSGRFVLEYQVTDPSPRWFFCAQRVKRSHCQAGMVFSLNPNGTHSQFLQNALAVVDAPPTETETSCQLPAVGMAPN